MYDEQENINKENLQKFNLLILSDYAKVLSTPEGRRVIANLMEEADPFGRDFIKDTNTTYFVLGQQNIGKYILEKCMQSNYKKYYQGVKEYNDFKRTLNIT